MKTEIALVYLMRGKKNGYYSALKFYKYYKTYNAGVEHNLYVIAKGWDNGSDNKAELEKLFTDLGGRVIQMPDDGYDWGSYIRFVKLLDLKEKYLCFLNTHSYPISTNWLKILHEGIKITKVGICGSTGSYSSWRFKKPLKPNTLNEYFTYIPKIINRIINHLFYSKYYSESANIHIRSNAFITSKSDFLAFTQNLKIPQSKRETHLMESGKKSYSDYILRKKKDLILAGKNGKYYPVKEWRDSGIYASGKQENLLVSDNNTRAYINGDLRTRLRIKHECWGYNI